MALSATSARLPHLGSPSTNNTAGEGVPPADYADEEPSPPGAGGAIYSGGTATPSLLVSDSTFTANLAGTGYRGTSFTNGNSTRTRGGSRGGTGGAIDVAAGSADISGSTFSANAAGRGGRSASPRPASPATGMADPVGPWRSRTGRRAVVNSTFSGNRAGEQGVGASNSYEPNTGGSGGAAFLGGAGSLRVSWSTFAGNVRGRMPPAATASTGAAIQVERLDPRRCRPGLRRHRPVRARERRRSGRQFLSGAARGR